VANLQEEIEILGSHMSLANLNPAWLPRDNNCGSCQASNNFINNTSSSHPSSLRESPINLFEQWSTSTNYHQEQVVPIHAENNGAYSSNSVSTMLSQPMPVCECVKQDDLCEISHDEPMVEGLLNQDIYVMLNSG